MWSHVHEIFTEFFDGTYLETQPIAYMITIPAIWLDYAQDLIHEAAIRAGIPGNSLTLVTESEAAAQYYAVMCEELELGAGDQFLVCDAGGGTMVSY